MKVTGADGRIRPLDSGHTHGNSTYLWVEVTGRRRPTPRRTAVIGALIARRTS